MASIEEQIRQARAQRAALSTNTNNPSKSNNDSNGTGNNSDSNIDENNDGAGIKFGTGVAYDDAYGGGGSTAAMGGGGDESYVTSLPTLEEERRLMGMEGGDTAYGGDNVRRMEAMEMEDAGRSSASHPSTLAAMKMSSSADSDGYAKRDNNGESEPNDGSEQTIDTRQYGGSGMVNTRISDRDSEYQRRRLDRTINIDDNNDGTDLNFRDAMKRANVESERYDLIQNARKELLDDDGNLREVPEGELPASAASDHPTQPATGTDDGEKPVKRRRRRWDESKGKTGNTALLPKSSAVIISDNESVLKNGGDGCSISGSSVGGSVKSRWDEDPTPAKTSSRRRKRWDDTPMMAPTTSGSDTPLVGSQLLAPDATPLVNGTTRWDETPMIGSMTAPTATPGVSAVPEAGPGGRKRSRWDATPALNTLLGGDAAASTPSAATASLAQIQGTAAIIPDLTRAISLEREMETRNRPWTNAALDAILPQEGYTTLPPPASYTPMRTPARKLLLATPGGAGSSSATSGFSMDVPPEERMGAAGDGATVNEIREAYGIPIMAAESDMAEDGGGAGVGALPNIKQEDMQYFGKLLTPIPEIDDPTSQSSSQKAQQQRGGLSKAEANERRIMTLLLKIKSGTPPQRKTAMRQITDRARDLGAGPLFQQLLPLLVSPTLEDQERHLLVKVVDRVLYRLDDLVRPYVHRILAVIQPLLIDEDYYARVEGREIISNLAKAAGLPTMIATMRPDVDNPDEYVRNTTSRAFAVVAGALGVPSLLPFLSAVCRSRRSWRARHTGLRIVHQIAILVGCAVLPHLRELTEIVSTGITEEQPKVRTAAVLAVAALAEAAHPYGIESFDSVVRPLWRGALEHRGKILAAFLKAVGFVVPLMEERYAGHYTRVVMPVLLREFRSPDEEMKKIVLRVVQQCVATAGVEPEYIRTEILPEFFRNFWIRRMALDRRNHKQVVETTVELANKVGCSDIVGRIVDDLKDDSEPYRRMVMETLRRVLDGLGAGDVDSRLEERLVDGILYAFQEQAVDASLTGSNAFGREGEAMLDGFGTVINALGERCRPYLKQIAGTIKWRLNNKAPSVRMQAADLIGRIAVVMKACGEDGLMGHLGVVLYEYLGEEYPEVLGSILGALRAIVNVIGMTKMTPPIRDLLPRLTPILRNRHEKVQENCIDLVGRIGDRGAEFVSAKEWMRICFELLEMLKAHKKSIRRAAVSTFGYIAKAIGPQDVLHTLLNNLKVQDRQMRVCTTVAIAIVAETCGPFTVLPALMNEYRVPELNIQNGVLKALSFVFEYIGEMAKDYVYAVAPLLEDALMDRDQVHRQTGCATVKHMALGVARLGCEDVLTHLLNFVWPNIFEQSPHVIQAVLDAVQGLMVALGPNLILQYTLQGLYHPARRVREVHWKVYNMLYIYAADAMVMGYPMLPSSSSDKPEHNYCRTTLELFI